MSNMVKAADLSIIKAYKLKHDSLGYDNQV